MATGEEEIVAATLTGASGIFSLSLNFGGSTGGGADSVAKLCGERDDGAGSLGGVAGADAVEGSGLSRGFNENGVAGVADGGDAGSGALGAGATGSAVVSSFGRSLSLGASTSLSVLSAAVAAAGVASAGTGGEISPSGRARGFRRSGGGGVSSLMRNQRLQVPRKRETKKIHWRSLRRLLMFTLSRL